MKKYFSIFALATLLLLTACGNDEPNNEQSSIGIVYSRAIDNTTGTAQFSQSQCGFTVRNNGSSMTMRAQMILKLTESTTVEFSTDFMPLSASSDEAYTYTFATSDISTTSGAHTISDLRGKINMVGPTYIEYTVDGKYRCYSTLQPYYTHTTTVVPQGEDSETYSDISYGVLINNAGTEATLYLFGFHSPSSFSGVNLCYDKLKIESTATGYHLTGTDIVPTIHESTYDATGMPSEQYRASSIDINITEQGQSLSGTISTGTAESPKTLTLNGKFFVTNYL